MEDVRIIRKLEDLDGLENGFGTKIEVHYNSINVWCVINFDMNVWKLDEVVIKLKLMGFKFEYKPLRTIQEVEEDMKVNDTKSCLETVTTRYAVRYSETARKYYECCSDIAIGSYVFSGEVAMKYADELNEIIRGR